MDKRMATESWWKNETSSGSHVCLQLTPALIHLPGTVKIQLQAIWGHSVQGGASSTCFLFFNLQDDTSCWLPRNCHPYLLVAPGPVCRKDSFFTRKLQWKPDRWKSFLAACKSRFARETFVKSKNIHNLCLEQWIDQTNSKSKQFSEERQSRRSIPDSRDQW